MIKREKLTEEESELASKIAEARKTLYALMKHECVITTPENLTECATARCAICGQYFGWYCPESYDGVCHYTQDFCCDYCGNPGDRK